MEATTRIELVIAILQTAALATWLRRHVWSGRRDSNPRHSAWEADALPLNYSRTASILYHAYLSMATKKQASTALHREARGKEEKDGLFVPL